MNASPDHSRTNPAATTLRAWLLSDAPASRRQATLGLAYRRWRRFAGNPL
ncbi:D,D-dipeptide ABC transporter permease, partial [Burkholderia pseudomallei]